MLDEVVVLDLDKSTQRAHSRDEIRLTIVAIVTAILTGIAGSRLDLVFHADKWRDEHLPLWDMAVFATCLIVAGLVAFFFGVRGFRGRFLRSTAIMQPLGSGHSFQGVVLSLSVMSHPSQIESARKTVALASTQLKGPESTKEQRLILLRQLCQIADPKDSNAHPLARHNWQQPLRVLEQNYQTVRAMGFALTPEVADGQYALFVELLKLLSPDIKVSPSPHSAGKLAVKHKIYNDVYKQLRHAANETMRLAKCSEDQLCLDITSSNKVFTAAATVITLNREAVFSYVVTGGDEDEGKVYSYDASVV